MRQLQIITGQREARARRHRDDEQFLPFDPRDPDLVRAKRLQALARLRTPASRGESTT
jgi:hypothetical protein